MSEKFWQKLDALIASSKIAIDRPQNTAHPRYPSFIYPLDYGFLQNTQAGDDKEIDVWIGSMEQKVVTGILCTVDSLKRDAEIKILVGCTHEDEKIILNAMNNQYMSAILVKRPS